MYRLNNTQKISEFKHFLKDNIAVNDKDEANLIWHYYNKMNAILDLNTYCRKKSKAIIQVGFGNILSDVVIILKSVEDKKYLDFFRMMMSNLDIDFHEVYFTFLDKSSDFSLNNEVLNKEIDILKPKHIITFDYIDAFIINDDIDILGLDSEDFKKMIELNEQKDLDEKTKKELFNIKTDMWHQLKPYMKYCSKLSEVR